MKLPSNLALSIWSAISISILLLGVAYAGGFAEVFTIPNYNDFLSIATWLASWVALVFPLPLIVFRFFRSLIQ